MSQAAAVAAGRPPFWRDVRILRVLWQILFSVAVIVIGREIYLNLAFGVKQQGVDLSWSFLNSQAGFSIKEGLDYSRADSIARALIVAGFNTIRIAAVGIVLASLLGLVIGVARLSRNWLVRKIAQAYVDLFRNTPVVIILLFLYFGVVYSLPRVEEGSIFDVAFVSLRGTAFPWPRTDAGAGIWGSCLLAALVIAWLVRRWRTRINEATGKPHYRFLWSFGVFLALALASYFVIGSPMKMDVPQRAGLRFTGGVQLSAEYFGLLVGLTLYTSAFIGEIIRGSILAVQKGQKEAGEALGLTPFQQLRFVVLPQAMRIAIPPINSQYQNLLKNSSLGLFVAYPELVGVGRTVINQEGRFTQVLVIWMLSYLAMTLSISTVMNGVNRLVAYRGARR
ncbi:MAG TPA: ABC transporter permease subunit [Actinomycetota bacterium]